jgi:hypothetical protein
MCTLVRLMTFRRLNLKFQIPYRYHVTISSTFRLVYRDTSTCVYLSYYADVDNAAC